MEKQLERIEKSLETLSEKVHSIDKTLVRNTDSLEIHIKRTELLEKEVAPIKIHVTRVEFVVTWGFKIIAGGGAVTGLGYLLKLIAGGL